MTNIFSPLKHIISWGLLFFILLVVLLGGVIVVDELKPLAEKSPAPYTVEFSVRPGMGPREIARKLEDGRIIRSKTAFLIYSLLFGKAGEFQPGSYTVGPEQSARDIVAILTTGPLEVEVSITPGMTMLEAEDILVAHRVLSEGDLTEFPVDTIRGRYPFLGSVATLEGFLFPDTYRFYPHSDPKKVVARFLDNFGVKTGALLRNSENSDTIHWLILASILEKEVTNEKEAQTVAGILEKRLVIGMPLQVDASIIYAKCKRFISCPALTRADFSFKSPYNTYLHKGLPPTPISNPGINAISAARSPVRSNYLYYLSDPRTTRTIFSKTFDEHNANRIKYLH